MVNTDYEHEKNWWNAKAVKEEIDMGDEQINRALRWREINKNLTSDITSVLEVGAATGAFSVPLAKRGYQVVHFDISDEMISIAKEKADKLKLDNISFQQGNSIDLSMYGDNSFDMVINMDGAVSFCGVDAEKAIKETIRVAGKKVIMTVSNRGNMLISLVKAVSWLKTDKFLPAAYSMLNDGLWHTYQFSENAKLVKGCTNDYLGPIKAFTLNELRSIFEVEGMRIDRLTSIGSLSNHCGKEFVDWIIKDTKLFDEFVEICDRYDKEICSDSIGSAQRAGIIIVASKPDKT
ncbi:MAG TPA: class I SAM-dependent methyltransferase [Clostridiales bacterium]|jgi:ubiquinone/menaquinone biosynthesis C-methylase UbiE|nr:class I SAM-dependent methyltransferase [Clostridiales bacterium]